MFGTLTSLYTAAGYRGIRPDHLGQGCSGNADDLSMGGLAQVYAAFIEQLRVGPVHWVGKQPGRHGRATPSTFLAANWAQKAWTDPRTPTSISATTHC
ncbi:alpha/beta fold hydrolase [Nocardia sp. NBC_01388]|uniref:alpha/beta fold hydrolase n=1 Tax=Nocardia sp. NBC_01388 TaxID=2903596 RepID=UPI003249CA5E